MRKLIGNLMLAGGSQVAGLAVAAMVGSVVVGGLVCVVGLYYGYQLLK